MPPKAIIFDLDGTLTESKAALEPEMGELLARLVAHMPVAIMSGGAYHQFEKQLLSGMPADTDFTNLYLFPTSAARCYAWHSGTWQTLYTNDLTSDEKEAIITALNAALRETGLDTPPSKLWGEQIEDRGAQITWSSLGQNAPVAEKMAWDPDRSKRLPLRDAILTRLSGFSVRVNASNSIDITREGLDKAYGIRRFSEIIKTPISEMLYVGDGLFPGGNDEVVIPTGIPHERVDGPEGTATIINRVIASI